MAAFKFILDPFLHVESPPSYIPCPEQRHISSQTVNYASQGSQSGSSAGPSPSASENPQDVRR
jgi:hypothetical protein